MNQKYITWGLAITAFVATLGISSWHQGLWHSEEPMAQSNQSAATDLAHIPAHPFDAVASAPVPVMATAAPPPVTTPVLAAATPAPPPPVPPPAEPAQSPPATDSATDDTPSPVPDVDFEQFQAQADRAADHSARTR
jgi:hypothetical protein